jgi:hypothetical protein
VTYNEHAQAAADTQQNEPVLACGVIRVGELARILVIEDGPGLRKRDPVLALVREVFSLVPDER